MSDSDEASESGNIEIFLRIKPIANPSKKVEYDLAEGKVRSLCSVPRRAAGRGETLAQRSAGAAAAAARSHGA